MDDFADDVEDNNPVFEEDEDELKELPAPAMRRMAEIVNGLPVAKAIVPVLK